MADIPIERKGGIPWWAWLLGLLALLLLLAFLMRGCTDRGAVVETNNNDNRAIVNTNGNDNARSTSANLNSNQTSDGSGQVKVSNGPMTDVTSFALASDKGSYVGRQAQLTGVEVQRVVSDRAFTVGAKRGEELYVLLDDSLNAGGAEHKVVVKPGQRLTLAGPLEKPAGSAEVKEEQNKPGAHKLNPAEAAEMKNQQAYLHANQIKLAQ